MSIFPFFKEDLSVTYWQSSWKNFQTDVKESDQKQKNMMYEWEGETELWSSLIYCWVLNDGFFFSQKEHEGAETKQIERHQFWWTKSCLETSFPLPFKGLGPLVVFLLKLSCDEQDPLLQHILCTTNTLRAQGLPDVVLIDLIICFLLLYNAFHSRVYHVISLERQLFDIKYYCLLFFFHFRWVSGE